MHQTGLKNFLSLKKLKIQFHGHILLIISMMNKLLEHFMKKNYKRLINKNLKQKKVIERKGDKLHVKWKGYDNLFNSWINKKDLVSLY